MPEQWFIDGWELTSGDTHRWEARQGTDGITALVGGDASIPLADGVSFGGRALAAGEVELALVALATAQRTMQSVWGEVAKVVLRRRRPVIIERHMGVVPGSPESGEVRRAPGVLASRVSPTHLGQRGIRATLSFTVLTGKWVTAATYTGASPVGSGNSRVLTVPGLAPSTAPMDPVVIIYGPATNPKITDETDVAPGAVPCTFKYAGAVPTGKTLTIDTANWSVTGSTGFTPDPGLFEYTGPSFFELEQPPPGGNVKVRLDCTGAAASTQFTVEAARAYSA